MPFPPLRPIEAVQIEQQGEPMILLNDPEGLMAERIVVSVPFFLILSMMDGQNGLDEIQDELRRLTGGQNAPVESIELVAREADQFFLFENDNAAQRRAQLESDYASLEARQPAHAGLSYPEEPDACREFFDELFLGLPRNHQARPQEAPDGLPRGLIVPHIDFRIGGQTIARGLAPLDPDRPPRLYVILGVAHRPTRNLFTLTDKDFETPLGRVATDRAAVARLCELYGADCLEGAVAHRAEHSVEFPAVALRYLHGDDSPFAILPILCGSLHELVEIDGGRPLDQPEIGRMIDALRTLAAEYAGEVCLLASVDLSHVGLKFGDSDGVDDDRARTVGEADAAMLRLVESMDPEAFFDHFRADANARNVDAVTPVYVMLHVLGRGDCRMIEYEQWREEETDSMVTYASLAIY